VLVDSACTVWCVFQIFGEFGGAEFVSSGVKNAIISRRDTVKTPSLGTPSRPVTAMKLNKRKTSFPEKSPDQLSQHSDTLLVPTPRRRFKGNTKGGSMNRTLHKRVSAGQLV